MADKKVHKPKINTKKKFVADGVFQAELNELLTRTLGQEGYAGLEVRLTKTTTQLRIKCANTRDTVASQSVKVKEIKSLIEKRYNFDDEENKLEVSLMPLPYERSLSASANAETLKIKLLQGVPVRTAANNVMNTVMRRGQATGCEVIISGKIRGQRAKAQKYTAGYQVSTGQPKLDFIDIAVRHVQLRQGILGLKVKVMRGTEIQVGNKKIVMPDHVKILEPKDENPNIQPQCHEMRQQHQEETQN